MRTGHWVLVISRSFDPGCNLICGLYHLAGHKARCCLEELGLE